MPSIVDARTSRITKLLAGNEFVELRNKMAWYNGEHVLRGRRLSKTMVAMTTAQCIEEKYIRFLAFRRLESIGESNRENWRHRRKLARVKVGKKRKKNSLLSSLDENSATLPSFLLQPSRNPFEQAPSHSFPAFIHYSTIRQIMI